MVLRDYLLGLPAFRIKSLFLAQQLVSRFIGLSCGEQYKLGLDNTLTGCPEGRAGSDTITPISHILTECAEHTWTVQKDFQLGANPPAFNPGDLIPCNTLVVRKN